MSDPTTDVARLTDAERGAIHRAAWSSIGCDGYGGHGMVRRDLDAAVERIVAARVAFVAEERDAAIERANFLATQARENAQVWPARVAAARADERERLALLLEQYDREGFLFLGAPRERVPWHAVATWLRGPYALDEPADPDRTRDQAADVAREPHDIHLGARHPDFDPNVRCRATGCAHRVRHSDVRDEWERRNTLAATEEADRG